MVWTSDASWGWRVLGLQWPMLVLMTAWPALGMDDHDRAKVHGWVLGSAGVAMAVCLGWGAWQLSQGEVLEGRDWSPWVSHVRLSLFAALGLGWAATSRAMWQLALFSLVWGAFVGVTGSLTSAVLLPMSWAWIGLQRIPNTWQPWYRGGVLALAADLRPWPQLGCSNPPLCLTNPGRPTHPGATPTSIGQNAWPPKMATGFTCTSAVRNGTRLGTKSQTSPCPPSARLDSPSARAFGGT